MILRLAHTSPSSIRASCLSSNSILWLWARTTARKAFISANNSFNRSSWKKWGEREEVRKLLWVRKTLVCLILSTHFSFWPLSISICLLWGYSWLWRLFLGLLGSRGRCTCGSCSSGVLRDELGFASEGVSVLGWRGCVPTAQRDQQGWCILSSNPFISQESRLQASCVRVKISLKQIWLWRQDGDRKVYLLYSYG